MNNYSDTNAQDLDDQSEPTEPRMHVPLSYYVRGFWAGRKLALSVIGGILILAIVFLLTRGSVYEATAMVGPNQTSSSGSGGALSSLALSAGFNIGGSNGNLFDKYQHLLQSTRLANWSEEASRPDASLRKRLGPGKT